MLLPHFFIINHGLEPYINDFDIVYLDDIYIYSDSLKKNIDPLRLVLQKLREHLLFMKIPKCFCSRKETEYLAAIEGNRYNNRFS